MLIWYCIQNCCWDILICTVILTVIVMIYVIQLVYHIYCCLNHKENVASFCVICITIATVERSIQCCCKFNGVKLLTHKSRRSCNHRAGLRGVATWCSIFLQLISYKEGYIRTLPKWDMVSDLANCSLAISLETLEKFLQFLSHRSRLVQSP